MPPKLEFFNRLSEREKSVTNLVINGHSTREISKLLGLGYETVKSHRKSIYRKLEVNSLAELITYFFYQQ